MCFCATGPSGVCISHGGGVVVFGYHETRAFTHGRAPTYKSRPWELDGVIFRTDYPYEVSARQAEIIADDLPPTGDKLAVDQSISVDLYPNPAADHLTISMDGGVREELGYAVVDMAGKVLLSGTLGSPQLMLSVGHLPTGAYLLVLTRATGATVSMSWIKQ